MPGASQLIPKSVEPSAPSRSRFRDRHRTATVRERTRNHATRVGASKTTGRVFALVVGLLFASLVTPVTFAAKPDKNHQDCFVPGPADEARIAKEVRHQLLLLPYYGVFDDLAFKIEGNTVTLVGATANPVLRSDAVNAVKRIEGVEKVNNEIELLPVSAFDDQIRIAEYRVIYGDPTISTRYAIRAIPPIHIIVKNGHVTLEGVVANQMDKQIIYLRANSVPNVFSVTNDLQVEHS